jgi:hypothetical protein
VLRYAADLGTSCSGAGGCAAARAHLFVKMETPSNDADERPMDEGGAPPTTNLGRRKKRNRCRTGGSEGRAHRASFSAKLAPTATDGPCAELGLSSEFEFMLGDEASNFVFFLTGSPTWPDDAVRVGWLRLGVAMQAHPDALTMPAVREAALRLCSTEGGPEHQPMVPWAVDGDGHAMEETVEAAWAAVMATPEMLPLHAADVAQRLANNIAYHSGTKSRGFASHDELLAQQIVSNLANRRRLATSANGEEEEEQEQQDAPLADAVEQSFLGALKHCANGVIVFPILGHLSTRPGHASGFQRQNQQNFDLAGC